MCFPLQVLAYALTRVLLENIWELQVVPHASQAAKHALEEQLSEARVYSELLALDLIILQLAAPAALLLVQQVKWRE